MKRTSLFVLGSFGALMLGSTLAAQAQAPLFSTTKSTTSVTGSTLPTPNLVRPLDTFTFDISGFNNAGTVGYILGNDQSATFGTTQTFTAAGYNGQDITITSSEIVGLTTTTDTFMVSTPTSFLTTTKVNGTTITALQFDLGNANSGVTFSGVPDPVNLAIPITSDTSTGNTIYGTANTNFTLTPGVTLAADGSSYSAAEGINAGSAISAYGFHSFTINVTYATLAAAPEPSTWASLIVGALGLGLLGMRAYKRRLDDAFGEMA